MKKSPFFKKLLAYFSFAVCPGPKPKMAGLVVKWKFPHIDCTRAMENSVGEPCDLPIILHYNKYFTFISFCTCSEKECGYHFL